MIEGQVKIVLSVKEVDKNNIWMRPYLDKDGYELLYFGSKGWTPLNFCNKCCEPQISDKDYCNHFREPCNDCK